MQGTHAAATVVLVGGVCLGLSLAEIPSISWLAALTAILILPAIAASRYATIGSGGGLLEKSAFAYGGIGLACLSLWLVGTIVGLNPTAVIAAPVLVSGLLVAVTRTNNRVHANNPRVSSEPRLPLASSWPHVAVWLTAVIMVCLVVIPSLPHGWQTADSVHRLGMTDWYKHLTVTTALRDVDFPPRNPFLLADDRAPYYYGRCSAPGLADRQLAGRFETAVGASRATGAPVAAVTSARK